MAWWALYKWFRPWRKTPYINYIQVYRKKLFDEWYESLTEEEKEIYQKNLKAKKERDRKHTMQLLNLLYAYPSLYEHRKYFY